jgi:ferredoxin
VARDVGYIIAKDDLFAWIDSLRDEYSLIGPTRKGARVEFQRLSSSGSLEMDYGSTMLSPRKFLYPPRERLFRFSQGKGNKWTTEETGYPEKQLLLGVHPCDVRAINILDKVFLGDEADKSYESRRRGTVLVALNCTRVCEKCFCESMGTGPFLRIEKGFDLALTDLGKNYLLEWGSERAGGLISSLPRLRRASPSDLRKKRKKEAELKSRFTKKLSLEDLPRILSRNPDHPLYQQIAEEKCLGCTNCTMVCPTCFCYQLEDRTNLALDQVERSRHWDSCQELHFAQVHGGNFRSTRRARLRQFITHKLSTWVEQYGCVGCVGCGRCMTWCPTGIDLTEIAGEIVKDERQYEKLPE